MLISICDFVRAPRATSFGLRPSQLALSSFVVGIRFRYEDELLPSHLSLRQSPVWLRVCLCVRGHVCTYGKHRSAWVYLSKFAAWGTASACCPCLFVLVSCVRVKCCLSASVNFIYSACVWTIVHHCAHCTRCTAGGQITLWTLMRHVSGGGIVTNNHCGFPSEVFEVINSIHYWHILLLRL